MRAQDLYHGTYYHGTLARINSGFGVGVSQIAIPRERVCKLAAGRRSVRRRRRARARW